MIRGERVNRLTREGSDLRVKEIMFTFCSELQKLDGRTGEEEERKKAERMK